MLANSQIKTTGDISAIIEYDNGKKYTIEFPNTVLVTGRSALAQMLTNTLGFCPTTTGSSTNNLVPSLYINAILFGTNGVDGNTPRVVSPARTTLYGPTVANKPVNAYVNQSVSTQAIFSSTLLYTDAVNDKLSEMALQMTNGSLYSMVTFPPIDKTAQMQITFNWTLNFV